jgi:pyruvate dehydrogenase E1 component beta subunit
MTELRTIDAIRGALDDALAADPAVCVLGEDVTVGGPFGATKDLVERYGEQRVRNTPISEGTVVGLAVGAALAGLRPVVEVMFVDFITLAMDQLVNHAAKLHYMTGGQLRVPLTIRVQGGAVGAMGAHHSQSLEAWFLHVPGLKVVAPSTPADARGLLLAAIRDDNPVVYLHHYLLTLEHGEVPDGEYLVPFGEAAIRREGGDVTIVATGWTVDRALGAAEQLASEGVQAEVIDPRTLAPLDTQTILESVGKTGRLVLVDQATRHASASTVIAGEVAEHGFSSLKAPIVQVTALDATIPYSEPLEAWVLPNEDKIVTAVQRVLGSAPVTA